MSHKQILGQLALSAALGFTGDAAQAQSELATGISTGVLLGVAANSSAPPSSNVNLKKNPPSIDSLGNLTAMSGNLSNIESCYSELKIVEKPLLQTLATNAQRVVNCVNQKNLDTFLADPSLKHKEISLMLIERRGYERAAFEINENGDFAKRVATECKLKGGVTSESFSDCAGEVYFKEDRQSRIYSLVGGFGLVAAVAGTMVWRQLRSEREELKKVPGAQPS